MGDHESVSMNIDSEASSEISPLYFEVPSHLEGERLDRILSGCIDEVSRGRVASWIKMGYVTVTPRGHEKIKGAHKGVKPSLKLLAGQTITCRPPPTPIATLEPQDVPFEVVYRDDDLAVINKPAGVVVHPGAGQPDHTLVNGLLKRFGRLSPVGLPFRPGIVHRIDRDTSGLLMVALNEQTHHHLTTQLVAREVARRYLALVWHPHDEDEGTIESLYGRHPNHRIKFTSKRNEGKRACTHWRILERFGPCGLYELKLETGRTHQIRVHLSEAGRPLLADQLYGIRRRIEHIANLRLLGHELGLKRHALHATELGFKHPKTGEWMSFQSPLPEPIESVIQKLRAHFLS